MTPSDTIFALSSGAGRAALAVVRLSGPDCDAALAAFGVTNLPAVRRAALRRLRDPQDGRLLDEAVVVRFAGPHSFTGEDMAELYLHGGRAVIASVLDVLGRISGCRAAEAGDFTRRAVMNGRLDLTAAEAIADLIDAEGGAQQTQALQQLDGGLRRRLEGWRDRLHKMVAHVEADIEFADEDLPGGVGAAAMADVPAVLSEMRNMLDDRRGVVLRDGVRIALVGPPNAGKSSLLNRLAGKEAAIVSARAGTTRDVIEVAMLMNGVPVTLIDTAGLRAAGDDIEREGVRRALAQAEAADINVLVVSEDTLAEWQAGPDIAADLRLVNKSDLSGGEAAGFEADLTVSAETGDGEAALLAALHRLVAARAGAGDAPGLTRQRHRQAVGEAAECLLRALSAADVGLELAAEDLRMAQRALGRITGAVDVEQLLDVVFADFCIGK